MRRRDELTWLIGLVILLIVLVLVCFYVVLVGCPGCVIIPARLDIFFFLR